MFFLQHIESSSSQTRQLMPPCEHKRVFKCILAHWKASAELQREIVSSGKIPMHFQSSDSADRISGISYELEESDLPGLLGEFKKDTRPYRITGYTEDQALDLLHDVFRVLRSTVKAAKPSTQAVPISAPVPRDYMYVSRR